MTTGPRPPSGRKTAAADYFLAAFLFLSTFPALSSSFSLFLPQLSSLPGDGSTRPSRPSPSALPTTSPLRRRGVAAVVSLEGMAERVGGDPEGGTFCVEALASAAGVPTPAAGGAAVTMARCDVASARDWLEGIESREGRGGAYSVLRCDVRREFFGDGGGEGGNDARWVVWGKEFHWERLRASYGALPPADGDDDGDDDVRYGCATATEESRGVLESLMREGAAVDDDGAASGAVGSGGGTSFVRTLMATILWTVPLPSSSSLRRRPVVRGHATFAGDWRPFHDGPDPLPGPVAACLAVPVGGGDEGAESLRRSLTLLPSRLRSGGPGPGFKLSSWCRARRPLDDPGRYKVPGSGVGEVLLVRPRDGGGDDDDGGDDAFLSSLDVLEGLTSNLFVVHVDGTVQTAPTPGEALPGYARNLVLDALSRRSSSSSSSAQTPRGVGEEGGEDVSLPRFLRVDESRAPSIRDALAGRWSEVFLTSAIRLVVPVSRIVAPAGGSAEDGAMVTLWKAEGDDGDEGGVVGASRFPVATALRAAILRDELSALRD